jgi:hypothetical protein
MPSTVSEEGSVGQPWGRARGAKIGAHAHLSVLFVASEQHIRRRLEGKVAHLVLVDNGGRWHVGFALRRGRLLMWSVMYSHIFKKGRQPLTEVEGL